MDALVSRALMIRLSLQPSPGSETSAFSNIRAFSNRCAGLFPFRISASSCPRSSALNRTTYLFTEISFAAMIASVVHTADEANHEFLSNWLKRATRRCAVNRRSSLTVTHHDDRCLQSFLPAGLFQPDERGAARSPGAHGVPPAAAAV